MKRKATPAQRRWNNQRAAEDYFAGAAKPVPAAGTWNEGTIKFTARDAAGTFTRPKASGSVKQENEGAIKTANRFAKGRSGARINDGSDNR